MRGKVFVALMVFLFAGAANAQAWSQPLVNSKSQSASYAFTDTTDSDILVAVECGSYLVSYESDHLGSNTDGSADLMSCPADDSVAADCTDLISFTSENTGIVLAAKPGYLLVDPTSDPTGTTRLSVYCGKEIASTSGSSEIANGITNGTATDATIDFARAMTAIQTDLSGFKHYYFSADAGGSMPVGDDTGPCSQQEPCLSLMKVHQLLFSQKKIVAVMDSGDEWNNDGDPAVADDWFATGILTNSVFEEESSSEGRLDLQPACATDSDELCLAIIGSDPDPANPWKINCTDTDYNTLVIGSSSPDGWTAFVNLELVNCPDANLDIIATCTADDTPFGCCTGSSAGSCVLDGHDVARVDDGKLYLLNVTAAEAVGISNQPYTAHSAGADACQTIMVNMVGHSLDDGNTAESSQAFAPVNDCAAIDINGTWSVADVQDSSSDLQVARTTGASSAFHVNSKFYFEGTAVAGIDRVIYNFNRTDNAGGELTLIRSFLYNAQNEVTSTAIRYTPGSSAADTSSVRLQNVTIIDVSRALQVSGIHASDNALLYGRCLLIDRMDAPTGLDDFMLDVATNFDTGLVVDIQKVWKDDSGNRDSYILDTTQYKCADDGGTCAVDASAQLTDNIPVNWVHAFSDTGTIQGTISEVNSDTVKTGACGVGRTCEAVCDIVYTEQLPALLPTIPAFVFGSAVTAWQTGGLNRNMGGVNP